MIACATVVITWCILGPKLKLKRLITLKKYAETIENPMLIHEDCVTIQSNSYLLTFVIITSDILYVASYCITGKLGESFMICQIKTIPN